MNAVIATTLSFTPTTCCTCGVIFTLSEELDTRRRKDHGIFWCPNGHQQHYAAKSETEQLRERLESEERRRKLAENNARVEAERAVTAENQLARLKHRIARGVCPCCKRTFTNIARHMASKHPETKT